MGGAVWLIGLDGASFDILEPIMEAGKMPVMRELMKTGATAVLKSTVVPFTPQAWASVITGNNPGRHGVFGFVRQMPGRPPEFLSSRTIQGDRLWTWFGARGLTNLVVNVPLTYPPEPLNGAMITGMMTPENAGFTYPPELKNRILADWPAYRLDVAAAIDRSRDLSILDELDSAVTARADLLCALVKEYKPDFFFPVFVLPDRIQHAYGHYIHPKSSAYESRTAEKWRARIWESYAGLDAAIGRLTALAPPGTNIIFISDHGFTVERGGFYTNDFLAALGALTLSSGRTSMAARSVIRKFNIAAVKRFVPNRLVKKTVSFTKEAIDWSRTIAYSAPLAQQGISINLSGREPNGIVSAHEYEGVREELLEALAVVNNPVTGLPVVKAYKREDVFSGPFLEGIPDIVLDFEGSGFEAKDAVLGGAAATASDGGSRGIHHRDGFFVASGPAVKAGLAADLTLEDIAPNVLALAGLDIPVGLDGRLRQDIFTFDIEEGKPR